MPKSPAAQLRDAWGALAPLPGGKWLFSRLFGYLVPYTGSIGAAVEELRPGYARLSITERRALRNHLNSVHAVALVNLAEATTGLAMSVGLPDHGRAIVTRLGIEYLKKSRGRLTCECDTGIPDVSHEHDVEVRADVKDAAGDVVARFHVFWRVGPDPKKVAAPAPAPAATAAGAP